MQVIIPMSGFGERFRKAGYEVPKPLIKVDSKEIIAHVVDMFPDHVDFIFICNQEHLDNPDYKMKEILNRVAPSGKIIGISPHKLGPIYAVLQAKEFIKQDEPCIVNYCDFSCYWDWHHFQKWVKNNQCAGAIPAYKGFHPHSLGNTNYAYIKEEDGWVLDIQEKKPFTLNKMDEFASSGTYFFSSGSLMLESFNYVLEKKLHVNGEYYVSLAYKYLLAQKLKVGVYPLQHFMQWGTPDDLQEYQQWFGVFSNLTENLYHQKAYIDNLVIPMAGLGQRFKDVGFRVAKPLIEISGKPMIRQVINTSPKVKNTILVTRKNLEHSKSLEDYLLHENSGLKIEYVPDVTEGQAITALIGVNSIPDDESVLISACDNMAVVDEHELELLMQDADIDVIVFGYKNHPHAKRNPQMYGWIKDDGSFVIESVSVKTPLSANLNEPIVVGNFIFKKVGDFKKCVENLVKRNCRVNGEFYLDSCIEDAIQMGLKCVWMPVKNYISWGTPNDLYTFEYWQSCFHKWNGHHYRLEKDLLINTSIQEILDKKYKNNTPSELEIHVEH